MKKIVLVLLCALGFQTQATTLVYKDMNNLVRESDGIVMGYVSDIQSKISDDEEIYTYIMLADVKTLAGQYDSSELTLLFEGGFVENRGVEIEGSPQFAAEEQVILFVEGNGRRIVPIVGWHQGVFKVVRDESNRNQVVTDSHGNPVYDVSKEGAIVKATDAIPRAHIVGQPNAHLVHSRQGEFDPGKTDDGSESNRLPEQKPKAPLELDRFIGEIESRLDLRIESKEIVSVSIGDTLKRHNNDSLSKGQQPGSTKVPLKPTAPKRSELNRNNDKDRQ